MVSDLSSVLTSSRRGDADAFSLAFEAAYNELRLAGLEERPARVVECRFFGGMTEEEVAEALGVTARPVRRDWQKARAFLYRELQRSATN